MSNIVKQTEAQLRQLIGDAFGAAIAAGELPQADIPAYTVEIPADRKNGDMAVNAAMVSARAFHAAPGRSPIRWQPICSWTAPISTKQRSPVPDL